MAYDFMVEYEYTKNWIPPRCRKPRPGRFSDTATLSIKSVGASETEWACIVWDYQLCKHAMGLKPTPLRWYDGNFYTRALKEASMSTMKVSNWNGKRTVYRGYLHNRERQMRALTVDELVSGIRYRLSDMGHKSQASICGWLDKITGRYLLVNGELWEQIDEPRYQVLTFGLGHNHGGTSWFIEHGYNSNVSWRAYFNANDFERMVEHYFSVALGRGDTNDAHRAAKELASGDYRHIEVLKPELFTCNPESEHGDGDPFMNKLYGLTQVAGSAQEAGLLALATLAGEMA